jgi:hypothetical protein
LNNESKLIWLLSAETVKYYIYTFFFTVEASLRSVGEVFVTEDQGSPHDSAFVPSNSVDPVYTNLGAPKQVDSIENSLGFGISHEVKENIIKDEYVEMSSLFSLTYRKK